MKALILALLLSGCSLLTHGVATSLDGEWQLQAGTNQGQAIPIVAGSHITLNVDGTKAGGGAACNIYGGTIQVNGSSVAISALSMTEMACQENLMASEAAYLSKAVGRPVQVVWTREEDLRQDFFRPCGVHRMRVGMTPPPRCPCTLTPSDSRRTMRRWPGRGSQLAQLLPPLRSRPGWSVLPIHPQLPRVRSTSIDRFVRCFRIAACAVTVTIRPSERPSSGSTHVTVR